MTPQRTGGLREAVIRRNIRQNTLNGLFSSLSQNTVQPFLGILAIRLGATNLHLALLNAVPALANIVILLPGARWIDRQPRKKPATAALTLAARCFYLLLPTLPLFFGPQAATVLVVLVALMNLPAALAGVAWQAVVAATIPAARRGQALAERNRIMALASAAVVILTGWVMDLLAFPLGYQVMFVAGFAFGLLEVGAFWRMIEANPERRQARAERAERDGPPALRPSAIADALRTHPAFLHYTLASMVFYLGWQLPWPLFTRYQVSVLGATNTWLSVYTMASTVGSVLTYGWWARAAQRFGGPRMLAAAALGLTTVPAFYLLEPSLPALVAFNLWVGMVASGTNLLLFNNLLDVIPRTHRTTYLAYYNTAISLAAVSAPLLGVLIADTQGMAAAFAASTVLRLAGALLLGRAGAGESLAAPAAGGGAREPR